MFPSPYKKFIKAGKMKREGRQHGMVRTFVISPSPYNPQPNKRILNRIDSPLTAGMFTKVPTRPTNHSKFTGKCTRARCSECHLHQACKSKYKTKGNNKNKSYDASEHQIVVDGQPGLGLSGISASGLLVDLADYGYDDNVDEDLICRGSAEDDESKGPNPADPDDYDHDDHDMDIYNVGLVFDYIEEGDWCIV